MSNTGENYVDDEQIQDEQSLASSRTDIVRVSNLYTQLVAPYRGIEEYGSIFRCTRT